MMRSAFSLLEIIIATAVLAASAMVLSSLIGLGTKYGNRAEEVTIALTQAQSLMDEFLAQTYSESNQDEITGELPGPPARGFRIGLVPFEIGSAPAANNSGRNSSEEAAGLLRVTVEVFSNVGGDSGSTAKPLVHLSRLIRRPLPVADQGNGLEPGLPNAGEGRFSGALQ